MRLTRTENNVYKSKIETLINTEMQDYRPWFSKIFTKMKIPYYLSAVILFGWTIPALALIELLFDWDDLLKFNQERVLLTYMFTSMILGAFPVVFTAGLYWWEHSTYYHMVRQLFFVLDLEMLAALSGENYEVLADDKRRALVIDEAYKKYKAMMLHKAKLNIKYVNHWLVRVLSMLVAFFYLYATVLNTGYPFLWHYIPYFFIITFTVNNILGSLTHVSLLKKTLDSFKHAITIQTGHPDGLGGISALKDMAINTTVLISSVAMIIPWLFSISIILGPELEYLGWLALTIIPLLIWLILGVFFTPTYVLYKVIKNAKDRALEALFQEYSDAFSHFQDLVKKKYGINGLHQASGNKNEALEDLGIYISQLKESYKEVTLMRTWPVSGAIIGKLVGSAVLPAVMPIINILFKIL